jgi:ABC-2 type transport system ATP-binding protein
MDHGKEIALGTPRELIAANCAEQLVEFVPGGGAKAVDVPALGKIAGVRHVRTENGAVRVQVSELHTAVPALLAELTRQNIPLAELRTHSATLEDVFVTLTGRHLRDE